MVACGVSRLLIASRRIESARTTAGKVGGEAVGLDERPAALAAADLLVSATSAPHLVVRADAVQAAMIQRPVRPLVVVDVAVPRDVEPEVGNIDGCTLFDVDNLASAREASLAARRLEAANAEAHIDRTVERFTAWWHGRTVATVVANLVAHAERVRQAEVERSLARLGTPTDRERALVESTSAAIVKKLLHQPIVELKRRGAEDEARVWARAIGELFALPSVGQQSAPETVRRPRRDSDNAEPAERTAS
jgi:glutamyl-tRNA reductase